VSCMRNTRSTHGENIQKLHDRQRSGQYRAQPLRRVYIPKEDGRQRLKRSLTIVWAWCQLHRHDPLKEQQEALNRKLRRRTRIFLRPLRGFSYSETDPLSWERECRQFSGVLKIADLNHWAGGLIVPCENGIDPICKIHSFSLDMNSLYHLGRKIGLVTGCRLHTG
jgi:hypothetical protein